MADLMARVEVGERRHLHWTGQALEEALSAGFLAPDKHYEVLQGELYEKMGQGWPHAFALRALNIAFRQLNPEQFDLSVQTPVRVGTDLPEPDLSIARGDFRKNQYHPSASDLVLAVEVADSSLALDRTVKASVYAAGGVPTYWLVDIGLRRVEVRTRPESGAYAEVRIFESGENLPPPFAGAPEVPVMSLFVAETE